MKEQKNKKFKYISLFREVMDEYSMKNENKEDKGKLETERNDSIKELKIELNEGNRKIP